MSSEYELWVQYRPGAELGVNTVSTDLARLEELAREATEAGRITSWLIIEKRTAVTFHVAAWKQ